MNREEDAKIHDQDVKGTGSTKAESNQIYNIIFIWMGFQL
jgi:hypothetical protein